MQKHSRQKRSWQKYPWWPGALSALAVLILLPGTGCAGYSNGNSNNSSTAPANTYAYIGETSRSTYGFFVAQFQVSSAGTFTALNPASVTTDEYDSSLTVDPSGKYLFTDGSENDLTPGAIRQFTIGSDGTLADNSVSSISTGKLPGAVAFTPDGRFAVASNFGDNTVSSYALNSTGSLSLINSVLTGLGPIATAIDSTGQFAYVAAGGLGNTSIFTLSEYTISSTGALGLVVTYPIAINPGSLVVSPKGFIYLTGYSTPLPGSILEFSINESSGGLSVVNSSATADGDPGPIMFDPTGAYAYVNNADSLTISQFTVNASTGVLTPNGPDVSSGIGPTFGVADPSGKFLYLVNQGQNNTFSPQVSLFAINADGTLTQNGVAASFGGPTTFHLPSPLHSTNV